MNFLCEPEVAKLKLVIAVNQHVLELDITVSVLGLGVERIESIGNLSEDVLSQLFRFDGSLIRNHVEEVHSTKLSGHDIDVLDSLNSTSVLRVNIMLIALDVPWDLEFALALDKVMSLEDVWVCLELLKDLEFFLGCTVFIFLAFIEYLNGDRIIAIVLRVVCLVHFRGSSISEFFADQEDRFTRLLWYWLWELLSGLHWEVGCLVLDVHIS